MWPFKSKKLSTQLQKLSVTDPRWFSLMINASEAEHPHMMVHLRDDNDSYKIQWTSHEKMMRIDLFGEKHLFGRMVDLETAQSFFLYSHLSIKQLLERFKALSLENAGSVTTLDLSQEGRAIEWLRVSFKVLKDAIESCRHDDSKIVQARLFMGKEAQESRPLFRMIVFNLDITCMFDPQGVMGVVVFDDKNSRHGTSQKPALEASFRGLKPAVLDELITLSAKLMSVVEEKTYKVL